MGYYYDSSGNKHQVEAIKNTVAVESYTEQDLEIKTNSDNLVGWIGTWPLSTLLFYIAVVYIVVFVVLYGYSKLKKYKK